MNHLFTEPRFAHAAVLLTPCPTPFPKSPVLDQELVDKKLLLKLLNGCKFKWGWGGDPSRQRWNRQESRVQKGKLTDLSKVARGLQTTGRFLFVHFLCGRPGAEYLKCTMSLYFTAIPEVETIISRLETGSSVQFRSQPSMPLCQDVLVECTTCQALGKGPGCTFSAQIRGKDCELHFTDEAAVWQGVLLTSLSSPKLGVPHPHALRGH